MSHPDEEEGEAEPTLVKYKPEKLVGYPGFNDSMPRGVLDVSKMQRGRERGPSCNVLDLSSTHINYYYYYFYCISCS